MHSTRTRSGGPTPTEVATHVRPGPRYTSYPPATEFGPEFGPEQATATLNRIRDQDPDRPVSLYCHIPFCRSLCWYCGCNVVISRDSGRGSAYVDSLRTELEIVAREVGEGRRVAEVALGGGSPNFLLEHDVGRLMATIRERFSLDKYAVLGVELDPRDTTREKIAAFAREGFTRLSVGVQDFHPSVQQAIHRNQTEDQTSDLIETARGLGFDSINVDLVYGLPLQTPETFAATLEAIVDMEPQQLAVFGYAHLPKRSPHQLLVERAGPIPDAVQRAELLFVALEILDRAGYVRIGLDHFARPDSPLLAAALSGLLHRNFQGYVVKRSETLLACGTTGISEAGDAFWQNSADLAAWADCIDSGVLPVHRGVALDADDRLRRHVITRLMCDAEVDFAEVEKLFGIDFREYFAPELALLSDEDHEALLEVDLNAGWLGATELGCNLIRNVCMAFDRYSDATMAAGRARFSPTV